MIEVCTFIDIGIHGVIKVGVIGDSKRILQVGCKVVGFGEVVRKGSVIVQDGICGSGVIA